VHIAVRGADQQLNGVLRQELPDLLRRLDEQGLQASAWTPSDTRLRTAESNSSEFSQQQGADSGAQNFNQNAQQQNERQRESPDPEDRTMNGKPKSDWKTAWSEFDAINTTDLFGARQ
jgi:hypothetical protein